MDYEAYIDENLVLLDVEASDKWALITQMVTALVQSPALKAHPELTHAIVQEAVNERERERPTGLGNGFAFPHARIPNFKGLALCLAMPSNPVDFDAMDGKPAEVICLMVVPDDQPQLALQVMSQFARLVSDPVEREILYSLRDSSILSAFVSKRVLGTDTIVTARDIMRQPLAAIHPDTPLRTVTRVMHQHMLDSIGVVEDDGTLVGQITCEHLFKLGMPDFFSQLKSIAFIRQFDPFEKYFEGEGNALARDVMAQDYATVTEDATLLEIVFELAVHHHSKVYVVRDKKRVGVIDRILVLDRVINI